MKKAIATTLLFALILAALSAWADEEAAAAETAKAALPYNLINIHEMTVNGEIILSKRYNIEGQTYVNIRDISHIYNEYVYNGGSGLVISKTEPVCLGLKEYTYQGIPCYNSNDVKEYLNGLNMGNGEIQCSYNVLMDFDEKHMPRSELGYYPQFTLYSGRFWEDKTVTKTVMMWGTYKSGEVDVGCSFVPKEALFKFNYMFFNDELSVDSAAVSVSRGGTEYSMPCVVLENSEVYVPIRSLAEVFGFDVEFENDTIKLTDESLESAVAPEGVNVYLVNGVKFLRSSEIEPVLNEMGYSCGLRTYAPSFENLYQGYYITPMGEEKLEDKMAHLRGISIPYTNLAHLNTDPKNQDYIMLMYDYFVNTGLL